MIPRSHCKGSTRTPRSPFFKRPAAAKRIRFSTGAGLPSLPWLLALLLLGGGPERAWGADEYDWNVSRFLPPDGHNFEEARDMEQTSDGALWLSSWGNGVARYYQSDWTLFLAETNGLPSNFAPSLCADETNGVWVATDRGIVHIDPGAPNPVSLLTPPAEFMPPEFEATCIQRLSNGEIWIGSRLGEVIAYAGGPRKPGVNPAHWRRIIPAGADDGYVVRGIVQTEDGSVWIARNRSGAARYREGVIENYSSEDIGVYRCDQAALDPEGRPWISGSGSPGYFDGSSWRATPIEDEINSMAFDQDGGTFLASNNRLHVMEANGEPFVVPFERSLGSPRIRCLLWDGQRLWIGTKEGIVRATRPKWRYQSHTPRSAQSFDGHAFYASPEQAPLSVGPDNRLYRFETASRRWEPLLELPGPPVPFPMMTRPMDGSVWIRNGSALIEVSLDDRQILAAIEVPGVGFVNQIILTRDHSILVAGELGAREWINGEWRRVFGEGPVKSVYERRDGSILVALENDLELWNQDRLQRTWRGHNRAKTHPYTHAAESSQGTIYIGSLGLGLTVIEGDVQRSLTIRDSLLSSRIYKIWESSDQTLWVAFEHLGVAALKKGRWLNYSHADGFPSSHIHELGEHPRGVLWAAGNDYGIYRYSPDRLPPETRILNAPDAFESRGAGIFAFEGYDAWNDTPQEELEFSWRFVEHRDRDRDRDGDGENSPWSPFDSAQSIANRRPLKPGRYAFEVKAADKDFNEDPNPARVEFRVVSSIWLRPLFYIPVTGSLLLALLFGVRLWVANRKLKGHRNLLHKKVETRTRALIRANAQIREEKERLAATLQSVGEGLIATNEKAEIILFNEKAAILSGVSEGGAVGAPLEKALMFVDPVSRRRLDCPAREVMRSKQPVHRDRGIALKKSNGDCVEVALSCTPISHNARQILGCVLAIRDMSLRRKHEESAMRAQKLESLGILAGGIAHDFNNLLTAILGNISLARDLADSNDSVQSILEESEQASLQARELTQQLLTFSKGGTPIRKTASIQETIQNSVRFALHGSKTQPIFDIPSDLWLAEVDIGQFSQVIQNLAINASQAMPEGGSLEIRARNAGPDEPNRVDMDGLKPGDYVEVSIRDRGHGIPPEILNRIFDPYFTTKSNGNGLGLSVCYSIIQQHEGAIKFDSQPNQGTTARIYLPANRNLPGPAREPSPKHPPAPRNASRPMRLLVMDDEKSILKLMSNYLSKLGHEYQAVSEGKSAVAAYKEALQNGRRFDAVILDLTVPGGMGGKDAMEKILEMDPSAFGVVSSGYSEDPVLANSREFGFQAILGKPYELKDLQAILEGRKRQQDADADSE